MIFHITFYKLTCKKQLFYPIICSTYMFSSSLCWKHLFLQHDPEQGQYFTVNIKNACTRKLAVVTNTPRNWRNEYTVKYWLSNNPRMLCILATKKPIKIYYCATAVICETTWNLQITFRGLEQLDQQIKFVKRKWCIR